MLKNILTIIIFSITALIPGSAFPDIMHPKRVDTARKCAICHYRWTYTFFTEHTSTPIAELQEDPVVNTREMCLSCHDGSVRDSRDIVCNDPGHRIGNIPSDKISIPDNFPLDENGAMTCGTCHTPHAFEKEPGQISFFLREKNVNSSLCKKCHGNHLGGKESGNHPVDISADKLPDKIIASGGKIGTAMPNQIICETCHIPHGGINSKFLVLSAEDPKTLSVLCEECHTGNPGRRKEPEMNRYTHPLDILPDDAVKIPKTWSNGDKVVLGPEGELVCRTCHKPHSSPDKQHLLADFSGRDFICIMCHQDQKSIAGSSHDLSKSAPDENNILGNTAAKSGPCSSCHLVHSGTAPYMWARKISESSHEENKFCITCHEKGKCAEKNIPGPYSHKTGMKLPEEMSDSPLPLFNRNAERQQNGLMACMTCHNPHFPGPDTFKIKNNKKIRHKSFLRLSKNGSSAHCISCHKEQGTLKNSPHDLSVSSPDYTNRKGFTTSRSGACSGCHAAHNPADQSFLWSAPMGSDCPTEWNNDIYKNCNPANMYCIGCHTEKGMDKNHVLSQGLHPATLTVPAGLSSDLDLRSIAKTFPLYDKDGKRSDSGTIVCTTCHDPHRWTANNMNITDPVFNDNITTRFLRSGVSNILCAGCHGEAGLFKYRYFHNPLSRKDKKEPFPFRPYR